MVFVATTASIVSGALAERVLIWPFFAFVVILTAILYPISLDHGNGAADGSVKWVFLILGSTIVHSVGGWAALTGAILLGARKGKFDSKGNAVVIKRSIYSNGYIGCMDIMAWMVWI